MTLPPPTTDEVRAFYVDGIGAPSLANGHRFDSWLATHDREVRAQVLNEAVASLRAKFGPTNRAADYLARTEQTKETSA